MLLFDTGPLNISTAIALWCIQYIFGQNQSNYNSEFEPFCAPGGPMVAAMPCC